MDSGAAIRAHGDGVTLTLVITPRAGRDEVAGLLDNALRLRLKAAPVEGRANEALLGFLAKRLGVSRTALTIVAGASSKHKIVHVAGLSAETATERLLKP